MCKAIEFPRPAATRRTTAAPKSFSTASILSLPSARPPSISKAPSPTSATSSICRASNGWSRNDHIINDVPVAGTVKGLFQLPAKPGLTHLDFRKHWITTHAQAALKMPGIRRYVQSHLVDEAYLYARPRFDGVAHVFFDSAEAMAQSFESPAGKADMADGELFIDVPKMSYFVAREHVVIDSR